MALITRPPKTGGNATYVDEVLGGNTTAKAAEVDADIDAITTQVNGNLDVNNLADDAVETAKIKDLNVTAAKLAAGAAASNVGALGIDSAELAASAIFRDIQEQTITLSLDITTVETDLVVLPAVTAITGGYCIIFGMWAMHAVLTGVNLQEITLTLYRGATPLTQSIRTIYVEGGTGGSIKPIPTQIYFDLPGAGSHVYTYKAVTDGAACHLQSPLSNAGRAWVIAI